MWWIHAILAIKAGQSGMRTKVACSALFCKKLGFYMSKYFRGVCVFNTNKGPCHTNGGITSSMNLSVRWRLKMSSLIPKLGASNRLSGPAPSFFSTETWHCGTLKCCSAFSGFHAQWLLGALALKAISAPSGVKLAWIYKSFKAEDWICSLNKGYVLDETLLKLADVYQSGEEHGNFILQGSVIQTLLRILR